MRNRCKTLLRDHLVLEVTLNACLRHYAVSAIPETLSIQGPKRPPINGGESIYDALIASDYIEEIAEA